MRNDYACDLHPLEDPIDFGVAAEYADQYAGTVKVVFPNHQGKYIICHSPTVVRNKYSVHLRLDVKDDESDLFPKVHPDQKIRVTVEFLLRRSFFDILHAAIEGLSFESISKVFPPELIKASSSAKALPYCNPESLKLDEDFQTPALNAIFSCSRAVPFLLTGAFGTGKTRLIVRAAHQIVATIPNSKVLICVHHNQTANSYIENYFVDLASRRNAVKAYRIISESKYLPSNNSQYYIYGSQINKKHRIIISTYALSKNLNDNQNIKQGYFSHIFLDEAAQCPEPEAMVPFLLSDQDTKVVLAGDHLQVNISPLGPYSHAYADS